MLGAPCVRVTLVGQAKEAKGPNSEREWTERPNANRKPLCHASGLLLFSKLWDKKQQLQEKLFPEDLQSMPGGHCCHWLCSQSEEQSHNLKGLGWRGQIQDVEHPESWVSWVSRTREDPQALSPSGIAQPAGTGYWWMLGWTLTTPAPHPSWSLAKQRWLGCYWSVSVPEQLVLGTCGHWCPECELWPAQGPGERAKVLPRA